MTDEVATSAAAEPPGDPAATNNERPARRRMRLWPGGLLVTIYWTVVVGLGLSELPITTTFMTTVGVGALVILLFTIWWLTNGTIRGSDRLLAFAALIVGAVAAAAVSQKTLSTGGILFFGLPWAYTAWIVWAFIARHFPQALFRWGTVAVIWLVWACTSLIRMDGLSGDLKADIHWRWEPTAEERYIASRPRDLEASANSATDENDESADKVVAEVGDWTAFRGPLRNGEVRGLEIATDWKKSPPELVWRQPIGPAWSSMLVVGGRLFTQEQVGEDEVVVCLDAESGKRIWSHTDKTRFWDSQSGAGPRGTPAFDDGALYTQGATGVLNRLDAATGKVVWSRDIAEDSSAPLPMWGFSSTPLVAADVVVTFAGGKEEQGLLAYHTADGSPAWHVATGPISYSSAQPVQLDGEEQVLFLSDAGLISVAPATGKLLWQYDAPGHGVWRATQPALIDSSQILFGSEDLGAVLLDLRQEGSKSEVNKVWATKQLKPAYNDFVLFDGCAYGFDGGIFCCLDAQSGKRRWKGGRYGHGQVLLLSDPRLLLVTAESGEIVLLSATPEKHTELVKFQAIEGKTWNHPAIAHGCLYLRNDQEIACYRLPAK
ncbi:MAG TPA: PQQ-binding-like beta-propeller repeat protein [Pirellulales bacterium]|nr:PQQ-binding-like beta-propeller repeat protein [Pirellulales bacterium]